MSDAIQTYGIRIKAMKQNLQNIKKMKQSVDSLQKHQRKRSQIASRNNKAVMDEEVDYYKKSQTVKEKEAYKVQKAITKREKEEAKKREQIELATAKKQYGEQTARRRQAVGKITERADKPEIKAKDTAFADMLKKEVQQEKTVTTEQKRQLKLEQQRVNALEKAKKAIARSALMQKRTEDSQEKSVQNAIKIAMAEAKTADELRDTVASERARLAQAKRFTAQQKRQLYLQRRITDSSKQFLGNYMSAFAVAGAGVGVTRIGQDFDRAANTLTALTGTAEEAGKEMQYLKDFTYEVGLPLRETAKDYSKFTAAVGDKLQLTEAKTLFEDLGRASVVMGSNAEESAGIFKALGQMLSKGKIQAKLFGPSCSNAC